MNLVNILIPKICINCKKIGDYLCKDCKKKLESHPDICPICYKYSDNFFVCKKCKNKDIYYEGIIIGFKYSGLLKKLILKLKYYHEKEIGDFLANRLNLLLQTTNLLNSSNIIVTSVPSHWIRKYFIKGYNQSEILAKKLSEISQIKYIKLCKKIKYTKSQTRLSKAKRLTNLQNSFTLTDNKLEGTETILIVDDITTTGSTINEIGKIIKTKYPNTKIWGLIVGRHY